MPACDVGTGQGLEGPGGFGNMSVFNPGLGYHYYSNREVPVTLVFGGNSTLVVTTAMPTNITTSSVTCGGEVVDLGNNTVIVRGVCYSTQQNPTVADLHTTDGYGTGSFSSTLEGLEPGTIYFLRAYVVSDRGITYGGNVAFTTDQIHIYNVAVSANPANGGTVAGGGSFEQGLPCTVTATPTTGYKFVKWTENGAQVSTSANYTFTVTGDRTLVAQFQLKSYTVTATADPAEGGTVTGGGTYTHGQTCTLTATPSEGYEFVNWTRNGDEVSTNATYSFTVTGNRAYVANFEVSVPVGAINGLFSVSATQQVWFSRGNLQYKASTNTWRFAENQYDYVGNSNGNISSDYSGWIDLFGWGTSGYNHGAVCYQPWSISTNATYYYFDSYYYAYGDYQYNLFDQTGQADWGYNAISNGGNQENQWRTLTQPEWNYVFNTRSTASGIRYAKAKVNNVNGVILLPDDWSSSTYSLSNTNTYNASFSSNTISASQWTTLESAGAVFLPAAGCRYGVYNLVNSDVNYVGSSGYYWSASYSDRDGAWSVYFSDSSLFTDNSRHRCDGFSVRLVHFAE